MDKTSVTKIRIEYSDGSVKESSGADAEKIMSWWNSCETMMIVHGHSFAGTPLREVKSKKKSKA